VKASDGEQRLHEHIFANYNTQVRPRHDPTQTVVVDLELNLHHLIKLVRQWVDLSFVKSKVLDCIAETKLSLTQNFGL